MSGDWAGVRRYGGALAAGIVKGWIWQSVRTVGQLVWGAIKTVTPIGLFETGPTWWRAIKDAWAGKRGGWDVTLTTLFLVANLLGIYGGVNGVRTANEFRTFSDTLSPAAQSQYISLNTLEQFRLFRTVRASDAPPEAVEFYLEQTARPGSPLSELPLPNALRLSALAQQSGRADFLIWYASRYRADPAMVESILRLSPDEINVIRYVYDTKAGQYRDLFTGRFVSPRDLPWPENRGFAIEAQEITLKSGTIIDRYGSLSGRYAGEPGTSVLTRGMAIGTEDMPYVRLRVLKPIKVLAGPAAPVPEFGAMGGSVQYYFSNDIQWLVDNEYLEIIP